MVILIALGAIGLHMHAKQNSDDNESRSKDSSLYNLDAMQPAAQKACGFQHQRRTSSTIRFLKRRGRHDDWRFGYGRN